MNIIDVDIREFSGILELLPRSHADNVGGVADGGFGSGEVEWAVESMGWKVYH